MILARAELRPGVMRDVRVAGGAVRDVATALARNPGEVVVDLDGRALLPGLTDHHIHLLATAAAETSIDCSPARVRSVDDLVAVLAGAPDAAGWVRGVGYDVDLAGTIDCDVLDRAGDRPIRVQDRTATWWVLNRAGLAAVLPDQAGDWPAGVELDAAGRPTGRLIRLDGWLRSRVPPAPVDVSGVGRRLAQRGVTALVDATATNGPSELALLAGAGLAQRLTAMTADPDTAAPEGVTLGAVKIVLDDADLPPLDALAARVAAAHAAGRRVAVHCVTEVQLVLALAAGLGAGDRIEHASLVPRPLIADLAARNLTVVTQPGLVWARGDRYLADVPPTDHGALYRVASLQRARIGVGGSSDAPFGPLDPWVGVAAAVERRTRGGELLAVDEAVPLEAAVDLYLGAPDDPGRPRRVEPGMDADLCVVDGRWAELGPTVPVLATLVGGRAVHGRVD